MDCNLSTLGKISYSMLKLLHFCELMHEAASTVSKHVCVCKHAHLPTVDNVFFLMLNFFQY